MLFELWGECKGTGSERKWEYFSWFLAPTLTGNMYSAKLSLATRIKGLCNNYQEGDCEKRTWHEVILGSAPCQQRQVSSDRPPGHLKIMTTPPPPSPPRLPLQWIHFLFSCNVFRRLCLEHYLKTTLDKADHFRTVRLRIVIWITGLILWVICITAFDFWLSRDQHEHNSERELLVPLSLHWIVNSATYLNYSPVGELSWCSLFDSMFGNVSLSCSFLGP